MFQSFFAVIFESFLLGLATSQRLAHSQVFHNRLLPSRFTSSSHRCWVQSIDWLECILRCSGDNNCISYHFDLAKGVCGLNSFGLVAGCDTTRLVHSEGVVFQQLREEKNKKQCLSERTCAPEQNEAGGESCSLQIPRISCKDIKDNGESRGDGLYVIKPLESTELSVYCDMTTDGGGWTLIRKTVLTSPPLSMEPVLSLDWRSIAQFNDPKLVIQSLALKELKNRLDFKQMRWFCYKSSVGRKVHIMTKADGAGDNVVRYFSESPPTPAKACNSFTLLPDDTSELGKNCASWGSPGNLDEWGRRDFNGLTRVQYDVMMWQKNVMSEYFYSIYPGRYLCDDSAVATTSINDTWAYYVR